MRKELIKYSNNDLTISSDIGIYVCVSIGLIFAYDLAKKMINKDFNHLKFDLKNLTIEASK